MSGSHFFQQMRRELLIHIRQPALLIYALLFFMMVIVFFPLTIPPGNLLRQVAPGLVWISVLLALLLASERLFQQDYEDGILEQWLVSGYSLPMLVSAKLLMYWLITMLPLLLFCPFLSLLYGFSWHEIAVLLAGLICGTPALLSLCALASAFSAGLQQKGMVMALILLPLSVPLMIFGSGSLTASMQGQAVSGQLALLLAMSVLAICLLPFAIAAIIRISLSD